MEGRKLRKNTFYLKPVISDFVYLRVKAGQFVDIDALKQLNIEEFRQNYNKKIQKSNAHLLEIIDLILKNDNDPLIIITGDHGSWGYRFDLDGHGNEITKSLAFLDKFGVLMAIRFPVDYHQQFDKGFRTHVNLFRYVFAYLSNSNKILEKKAKDDIYLTKNIVASFTR